MVREPTFRQRWGPYCDHVNVAYQVVSWYESETRRLRVGYYVREHEARMLVAHGGGWRWVSKRRWVDMSPETARSEARLWLAAEVAARWPEPPTAVVNPVGCRATRPPKTVRR